MEQTEKQQDNKVMLNQVHHPEEVYIYTCIYKHTYIKTHMHIYMHWFLHYLNWFYLQILLLLIRYVTYLVLSALFPKNKKDLV